MLFAKPPPKASTSLNANVSNYEIQHRLGAHYLRLLKARHAVDNRIPRSLYNYPKNVGRFNQPQQQGKETQQNETGLEFVDISSDQKKLANEVQNGSLFRIQGSGSKGSRSRSADQKKAPLKSCGTVCEGRHERRYLNNAEYIYYQFQRKFVHRNGPFEPRIINNPSGKPSLLDYRYYYPAWRFRSRSHSAFRPKNGANISRQNDFEKTAVVTVNGNSNDVIGSNSNLNGRCQLVDTGTVMTPLLPQTRGSDDPTSRSRSDGLYFRYDKTMQPEKPVTIDANLFISIPSETRFRSRLSPFSVSPASSMHDEELKYLLFLEAVTSDVVKCNAYSDSAIKDLFNLHMERMNEKLDLHRMKSLLLKLLEEIGISSDDFYAIAASNSEISASRRYFHGDTPLDSELANIRSTATTRRSAVDGGGELQRKNIADDDASKRSIAGEEAIAHENENVNDKRIERSASEEASEHDKEESDASNEEHTNSDGAETSGSESKSYNHSNESTASIVESVSEESPKPAKSLSTNQSINQSTNQSINRSINQSIDQKFNTFAGYDIDIDEDGVPKLPGRSLRIAILVPPMDDWDRRHQVEIEELSYDNDEPHYTFGSSLSPARSGLLLGSGGLRFDVDDRDSSSLHTIGQLPPSRLDSTNSELTTTNFSVGTTEIAGERSESAPPASLESESEPPQNAKELQENSISETSEVFPPEEEAVESIAKPIPAKRRSRSRSNVSVDSAETGFKTRFSGFGESGSSLRSLDQMDTTADIGSALTSKFGSESDWQTDNGEHDDMEVGSGSKFDFKPIGKSSLSNGNIAHVEVPHDEACQSELRDLSRDLSSEQSNSSNPDHMMNHMTLSSDRFSSVADERTAENNIGAATTDIYKHENNTTLDQQQNEHTAASSFDNDDDSNDEVAGMIPTKPRRSLNEQKPESTEPVDAEKSGSIMNDQHPEMLEMLEVDAENTTSSTSTTIAKQTSIDRKSTVISTTENQEVTQQHQNALAAEWDSASGLLADDDRTSGIEDLLEETHESIRLKEELSPVRKRQAEDEDRKF